MKNELEMYLFAVKVNWNKWEYYSSHKVFRAVAVFARESSYYFLAYFILQVCGEIKGFDMADCAVCLSLVNISYGLYVLFFTGLRDFKVNEGYLDAFRLKPKGILTQALLSNVDWYATFGHVAIGGIVFVWGCVNASVVFTPIKALFFVINICGSVLIYASVHILSAAVMVASNGKYSLRSFLGAFVFGFIRFPICWFGRLFPYVLTYIFPIAFYSYYPALQILDKETEMPQFFNYMSFPIGLSMYLVCYLIWRVVLVKKKIY